MMPTNEYVVVHNGGYHEVSPRSHGPDRLELAALWTRRHLLPWRKQVLSADADLKADHQALNSVCALSAKSLAANQTRMFGVDRVAVSSGTRMQVDFGRSFWS